MVYIKPIKKIVLSFFFAGFLGGGVAMAQQQDQKAAPDTRRQNKLERKDQRLDRQSERIEQRNPKGRGRRDDRVDRRSRKNDRRQGRTDQRVNRRRTTPNN
ncbi:MAG: hypothetical protein WA960_00240 [Tunicatimonas sp.]